MTTIKEQRDKDKIRKENLGKFLYDLAKIVFTTVFIGAFTPFLSDYTNFENLYTAIGGLVLTVMQSFAANKILK